ncbi:MAG: type IV pilus secretin PilQ [Candidatus Nitronauta litoralis]|uniref:Type IV pilus secretin PilQ n=1 Tax=Candidatus Nitronauta litoralis TaxID=2705533 RepID=A0A7T0BW88_9BACT|nr:MAG: type IV pilus secretin PilQ [Candidatus Nitronauta litoralis]
MKQTTWRLGLAGLLVVLTWGMVPVLAATAPAEVPEEMVAQAGSTESAENNEPSRATITDIRTETAGDEVTVEVEATGDLQYTAFKLMDPLRLVLDFQNMETTSVSGLTDINKGVVKSIRPLYFDDAAVQRLEFDLASTAVYEIQKPESNKLVIKLKGAEMQAAAPEPEKMPVMKDETADPEMNPEMGSMNTRGVPGFQPTELSSDICDSILNEKDRLIKVEFQNAELRNIFRFLAESENVNLVVSQSVSGTVTMKVDAVAWKNVLELILANYKLGRKCEGNVVRIGLEDDLIAERFNQPLITQMVRLNYGDPDEVIKNLDKMKSNFGKVVSDKRTNSIIVTDTETSVLDMMTVINNLDQPTTQVQIESKIIQINRDFLQEIGIQWGFDGVAFRNPDFPNAIAFSGAAVGDGALSAPVGAGRVDLGGTPGNLPATAQLATPRLTPGFIVDLATVGTPFGGIATSLRALGGDVTLDLQLSALERQGKSKTVASPKVTTLNNKEAKIRSGTRLPFQTTDPAEGTKIEFIDAVIELKVTPQITSEDMVYMKVAAQQNTPDPVRNVGGTPVILTKEAFTELLVGDKDTAVIGGLFQKRVTDTTRAIPYASEIPIIGQLFKSNADSDNISELLILIKPTIVKGLDS